MNVIVVFSTSLESIASVLHGRLMDASKRGLVGVSVGHSMHVVHGIVSIGVRAVQFVIVFAASLKHTSSILHGWLRAIHGSLGTIHGRLGTICERLRGVCHGLVAVGEGLLGSVSSGHSRHHLVMRLNK